jgi:hypothetical protein
MDTIAHFLSNNPIALVGVIILLSFVGYAIVKRLAKLALFLLVAGVIAYFLLRWLGRV